MSGYRSQEKIEIQSGRTRRNRRNQCSFPRLGVICSIFSWILLLVYLVSQYLTAIGGFRRRGLYGISAKSRPKARETQGRREHTTRRQGAFYSTVEFASRELMKVKAKRTMGTDESFIGPFSSLLFLLLCPFPLFLLFSALLQDG